MKNMMLILERSSWNKDSSQSTLRFSIRTVTVAGTKFYEGRTALKTFKMWRKSYVYRDPKHTSVGQTKGGLHGGVVFTGKNN